MEILEYFDKTGKHLGAASKKDIHERGLFHKAANIWILNSNNELLIQKRSSNKKQFPGFWSCSVGGHVVKGESFKQAAIRETKEELGLEILEENLSFLVAYDDFNDSHKEFIETYYVIVDLDLEKIELKEDEVNCVKFVNIDDLNADISSGTGNYLINSKELDALNELIN